MVPPELADGVFVARDAERLVELVGGEAGLDRADGLAGLVLGLLDDQDADRAGRVQGGRAEIRYVEDVEPRTRLA
jgi:hypothetical protein